MHAAEMGFPTAATETAVKDAYKAVIDHYRDITTAPDNRLKRVYYHSSSDHPRSGPEDHLAHEGASVYVPDQWSVTLTLGAYHRDQLTFTNPGRV